MTIKSNRQVLSEQLAQGKIRTFDIQDYTPAKLARLSEKQAKDFMLLCKDLLTNMIKPYNYGWRFKEDFEQC